jgi:hypothetical protein
MVDKCKIDVWPSKSYSFYGFRYVSAGMFLFLFRIICLSFFLYFVSLWLSLPLFFLSLKLRMHKLKGRLSSPSIEIFVTLFILVSLYVSQSVHDTGYKLIAGVMESMKIRDKAYSPGSNRHRR